MWLDHRTDNFLFAAIFSHVSIVIRLFFVNLSPTGMAGGWDEIRLESSINPNQENAYKSRRVSLVDCTRVGRKLTSSYINAHNNQAPRLLFP